jgi:pimeloyl-ACP methyl ester carboxylesterase
MSRVNRSEWLDLLRKKIVIERNMIADDDKVQRKSRRVKSLAIRIVLTLAFLFVVCAIVFVVWAWDASQPESKAYTEAISNPAVTIDSYDGFITIRPAGITPEVGLLFYPGARIEPSAYVAKLAAIAEAANIQIAIGKPALNLAFFSINQADNMRTALPGVTCWFVGGHSLGGSMACVYASNHSDTLEGVMLFGTYCGTDISNTSLRVLSINGERDGIFPPAIISERRHELPSNARMVLVPGMNHAQIAPLSRNEAISSVE